MMQFSREINRLLIGGLCAFLLVGISAAYWSIVGPDTILLREDNPRLVEAEAAIQRGAIMDRSGEPLVVSTVVDGVLQREYQYPAMYSTLGYYSLRYGVGGAEAAYDTLLRGDDLTGNLEDYVNRQVLHQPQRGSDVQLTFDLALQQQAYQAMQGQTGAVLALNATTGEVLALVSLPTYDPNTLDANWETLVAAPGNPFFNRALQSTYQPGGMFYTPLLASTLAANQTAEAVFEAGTIPVRLLTLGIELRCAVTPPRTSISLGDAYVYGCPAPFADIARVLGSERLYDTFQTFELTNPPTLEGFVAQQTIEGTLDATAEPTPLFTLDSQNLLENALGQGQITMTPLNMAEIVAAVMNGGNAPAPYTLLAVRRPDAVDWTPANALHPTRPFMTAETADLLAALMRESVLRGTASAAAQPGLEIGGQAALAYAGETTKAWFAGFVITAGDQAVVVIVVLEDPDAVDASTAARIGGQILAAAAR
jgi:penicillin-binding protein A